MVTTFCINSSKIGVKRMFSKSMEMLVNILTYVILAFLLERMRREMHGRCRHNTSRASIPLFIGLSVP